MTLADEIRNSFVLPDSFIEEHVIPQLKNGGRFSIISDNHIGKICNYAIPKKYEHSLIDWATRNGFSVGHHHNSYGVHYLDITI